MENYNMSNETKSELKIIVAEMTQDEHKALMQILVSNLTHSHNVMNEMKFMPIPACDCGKCDGSDLERKHKDMVETLERGVKLLASVTEKLK